MKQFIPLIILAELIAGCSAGKSPPNAIAIQKGLAEEKALEQQKTSLKTILNDKEQLSFRLDYAKLLIKDNRQEEAERLLNTLRKHETIAAQVYPLLADVYELQKKWDKALIAWQESIQRAQKPDIKLEARLARAALRCQRYTIADNIYQKWLSSKTDDEGNHLHITALNNLGFSYMLQKNYPLANLYFNQTLELDPLNKKATTNKKLLLELEHRQQTSTGEQP